jgi:phosphate starvation-inducible PhoH-like protein
VVRHHLVQRIVRAYDTYGRTQQQLPLNIDAQLLPDTPKPQPIAKPQ